MYTAEAPETQTKKERILKLFPTRVVKILSIIQLVCAVLTFAMQVKNSYFFSNYLYIF